MAFLLLALVYSAHLVAATLPQVDFDRMGKVGLAGAFAGLDIFQNTSFAFNSSTSTFLSRALDGSLSPLASTNTGGRILAGCVMGDVFYFAGTFSSIGTTNAANVASYTTTSGVFTPLGSGGPNGQVDTVYCDVADNKLWVGGAFTSPGSSVAVWDIKGNTWNPPPFVGVVGAQQRVLSITTNSTGASLFFAGSFVTSFGNVTTILNGTNNPNVPFSSGATPFSSSLVPVPLQNAQVDGSGSTTEPGFSDIHNILCPAGADGPGNSWFGSDGNEALVTIQTFTSISSSGVRLGNTFQPNHGTTGFSVTTIPDNKVQSLIFVDPATGQNQTCTDPCPLSVDASILYQDFLFESALAITGVQVKLSQFTGAAPGLHIVQLLSSGAFASSIDSNNIASCFASNPSNATFTGNWTTKVATTDIAGTVQTVLISSVAVGTPSSSAPSFTWMPYVSASGNYDINLLIPGCTDFQDCALRTSVKVTVFPGEGIQPWITSVSQQNTADATVLVYSGPVLLSSTNFVTPISMTLADNPAGTGQGGSFELVADRVQLILKSALIPTNQSDAGPSLTQGERGFGFLEWPRSLNTGNPAIDGTKSFPNSSQTALDAVGLAMFNGLGESTLPSSSMVSTVAHHSSGLILLGGTFTLSSGPASGAANVVGFRNGELVTLAQGGLNGGVTSFVLHEDQLFVGGSFTDTLTSSSQGRLAGIALYNVLTNTWSTLAAGLNGAVLDIGLIGGQIQAIGNFTQIVAPSDINPSIIAEGIAVWDIQSSTWINSGGFVSGSLSFIGNGTSQQYVAGNVGISRRTGATGMVMLQNSKSDIPQITPLGAELGGVNSGAMQSQSATRRSPFARASAWVSHMKRSRLFSRQTGGQTATLPTTSAPAPAVLAGAFWTNTSSSELVIIGGNFSYQVPGSSTISQSVAIYDPNSGILASLPGSSINGTVQSLLVDENQLYVGGQFTVQGVNVNGLGIYDLSRQQWDDSIQMLQGRPEVVVRSITKSTSKKDTIIVAGTFSHAGSLICESICFIDTVSKQWNSLGNGIQGEVSSVAYAGNNQEILVAAGSISLSDNTPANVAQFNFANSTWTSVGVGSDIPGPVTAVEVNAGNDSSIFAAGMSIDGSVFLTFWDGVSWENQDSTLQSGSTISQLTMVPLQSSHAANGIIQSDRMLMVNGALSDNSFGNVSSALFDGEVFIPYIVSTSSSGGSGFIAALFRSFPFFSFNQRRFLATGVVILISIAIAAGVVFLLALIGILWTLFSRREDKLNKFDLADDDDNDSTHHRPSSLLEHINAATRTTILGTSPSSNYKEDEKVAGGTSDHDPFAPDGSNYVRAETPSDAVGGLLAEELSRPAHARYSFDGTGEGELPISAGAEVEVLDDRDPAWWYARDVRTGREGVVPAAYLY